ncbi:hypothetical protein CHS0354_009505 [Potamilus streckersoni]|uniref:Uncharacterized protein n=1 Tax=Potamilus streckersoni TaxID=2493646 RepID=A0AAE0RW03_9BIVA|nr:hypothetical protein CHS0354_009505 [Potamilus streckersoni]
MGLERIFFATLALIILGNAETRHTVSSDQRMRIPTGSALSVISGPDIERKMAVLNKPSFVSVSSRIQLNANTTQTGNNLGGFAIKTSGISQRSNSLPRNPNVSSPDMDISNSKREGIKIGSMVQPFGEIFTGPLSRDLLPVRVSDKPLPGLEINVRGSFGDINIPKMIEVALNSMWGQNQQMSRDIKQQYSHVHVDSTNTVMGHNIKLDPTDLKLPVSRAASISGADVKVLHRGLQTMPVSQRPNMKETHESNLHSRGDQEPLGPVGFLNRLARLKLSNSSRQQPSGGEKLNIADAVPLHLLGISSSQGVDLSSPSSSLSSSFNTSNIESQLARSSASMAGNPSDRVWSNKASVMLQPTVLAGLDLRAEPYFNNVDNNRAVHPTVAGDYVSDVSLSSLSSGKRSTKVIQKSVTKTTIKKTVTSAKANTAAASAVGGSSVAAAASVGIDSTDQPRLGGSIEVQQESNRKTKIIFKETNNDPIVLQATGPVRIQRIVTPNGTIKFKVSPVRQSPVVAREIEDDEIPITTTALTTGREPESRFYESLETAQSITTTKSDSPSLPHISFL